LELTKDVLKWRKREVTSLLGLVEEKARER
jgi:hypothetical protein